MATTERHSQTVENEQITQVRRIARIKIRRFSDQPRTYFDGRDMSDLAASIEEIGQQTPIVVKAVTGDPKHDYELVDGERRWIACGIVGVEMMLAWVKNVTDVEEQFVSSVVGNFGRSGHTALEISKAIDRIRKSKRLQELSPGEQVARIAKIFARSEPWVYQHLAILRLHPDVQAMMAPTIPEEERLSNSLGVFISSLHHDLQLEIAKMVVAKKLNINQARVHARQMAEEAGEKAGTAKRPHLIGDYYRSLQRFVQRTQEGVDILLSPPTLGALQRRDPKDLALMATEIGQCITRLSHLRATLIEPARQVESPKLIHPSPASTSIVVDIRTPRTEGKKLAAPSAEVSPRPSSRTLATKLAKPDGAVLRAKEVMDQNLAVSHRVLLQLFYSGGFRRVDLSRVKLRNNLGSDGEPQELVRNALNAARERWRVAPKGSENEQKFIRLISTLRHDFGDPPKFDDFLRNAKREDKSYDPVSL